MSFFDFIYKKNLKIGLALSGGATYGAAHIGVLKVLDREGIRPRFVVGASAGALVGAAYCAGIPLEQISQMFNGMSWPTLIKPALSRSLSLFDTSPMEDYLLKNVGDCEFKDLQIPFAVVACDIMTGERVFLNKGALVPAVRASAAIPGLLSPVEIDDRLLVDGGTVDNFPVESLRPMGANYIIGVDLSRTKNSSRRPTTMFEVFMNAINIMQSNGAVADSSLCNCYIRPKTEGLSRWSFNDSVKLQQAGMDAAEAALPKLKRDLHLK